MSETDSFIDEVTEEVRRDRLFAAFRKYGWIGGVAIVAIVGGAAWSEWTKAEARAKAQAFGDAVLAAAQTADPEAALAALPGTGAQAGLGALMTAAQAAQAGHVDVALAQYRAAAASAELPASLRDLARIKALILAGSAIDPATRASELADLARAGAPYRLLAVEQQALDTLAAGDREGAIAIARGILADAGVTPGLQQRASELIVALGGDPAQQ